MIRKEFIIIIILFITVNANATRLKPSLKIGLSYSSTKLEGKTLLLEKYNNEGKLIYFNIYKIQFNLIDIDISFYLNIYKRFFLKSNFTFGIYKYLITERYPGDEYSAKLATGSYYNYLFDIIPLFNLFKNKENRLLTGIGIGYRMFSTDTINPIIKHYLRFILPLEYKKKINRLLFLNLGWEFSIFYNISDKYTYHKINKVEIYENLFIYEFKVSFGFEFNLYK